MIIIRLNTSKKFILVASVYQTSRDRLIDLIYGDAAASRPEGWREIQTVNCAVMLEDVRTLFGPVVCYRTPPNGASSNADPASVMAPFPQPPTVPTTISVVQPAAYA